MPSKKLTINPPPEIANYYRRDLLNRKIKDDANAILENFTKAKDVFIKKNMSPQKTAKCELLIKEFLELYEIAKKKENAGEKVSYTFEGLFYRVRIHDKRNASIYEGFTSPYKRKHYTSKARKNR